jgi:2-succinyl-6-hydroxy-2,4-cyclohexadiene-1-carboxylate synthase
MPRIGVNGVQLNIEISGSGMPLVLLHGFTGSARSWLQHISALSEQHQVIAVDLLGHGQSDSPDDSARYSIECCTHDLSALFNQLGLERFYLLGYSMGGRVALHFALTYPERLAGLILESASPGIADPQERQARLNSDIALAERIERDGLEAFVDYWERLPLFASQAALPPGVREQMRRERLANNPDGLANSLRGLSTGAQPSLWDRLPELRVPTLIIAGAFDEKFTQIGKAMATAIPNAQIEIVQDADHTIHLTQPEQFRLLILSRSLLCKSQ